MVKAILFDMDNTLLVESDEMGPAFIGAAVRCLSPLISPEVAAAALIAADQAIDAYAGAGMTAFEMWETAFYAMAGLSREQVMPLVHRFVTEDFPGLRCLTRPLPEVRQMMEWLFDRGIDVAIATGALLPQSCLEDRLEWAGVPVTDFEYAFLTTWNNMHAGKLSPAYYRELLACIGRQPWECLMVGDSLRLDMAPAIAAGIPSYWITPPGAEKPEHDLPLAGQGALEEFYHWLHTQI